MIIRAKLTEKYNNTNTNVSTDTSIFDDARILDYILNEQTKPTDNNFQHIEVVKKLFTHYPFSFPMSDEIREYFINLIHVAENNKLYIIMRSDMESHTNGKKMAQASHASNAFVHYANEVGHDISLWTNSTTQGCGTVLVLDGGAIYADVTYAIKRLSRQNYLCGIFTDPTYPVMDGTIVHYVNVETCAWVYCDETNEQDVKYALRAFPLHP